MRILSIVLVLAACAPEGAVVEDRVAAPVTSTAPEATDPVEQLPTLDDTTTDATTSASTPPVVDAGPLTELCINELMPANDATLDVAGLTPDWIELHNPTAADVSLDGWGLTDDRTDPYQHLLDGLVVPAGGMLLLYADGQLMLGADHVAFSLDAAGEEVGLFAPDGRNQVIAFGALDSDVAAARVTDCCEEAGCWTFVYGGTPNVTNEPPVAVDEVLVAAGSPWRYDDDGASDLGWSSTDFDASAWAEAVAPLGYGDAHIASTVSFGPSPSAKQLTTWFRAEFDLVDADQIDELTVSLLRDDGAVVWLNGVEVARQNLAIGVALTDTTRATTEVTGADETAWFATPVDPALLVEGTNVLAVELHLASPTTDDLGFDLALDAVRLVPADEIAP